MSFPDFIYNVAHDYPGGVPALAARMNKNKTVLQHKLNPNCETHGINADEIERIVDMANANFAAAEHFAHKAGALVVQLPDMPQVGDMELLDEFMSIMAELGQLSAEFQRGYSDGQIDSDDLDRISKEATDVHSRLLSFMKRVESMAVTSKDKKLQAVK
jgi:hypothetical protein